MSDYDYAKLEIFAQSFNFSYFQNIIIWAREIDIINSAYISKYCCSYYLNLFERQPSAILLPAFFVGRSH